MDEIYEFINLDDSMSESDADWSSGDELSDQDDDGSPPFRGLLSRTDK